MFGKLFSKSQGPRNTALRQAMEAGAREPQGDRAAFYRALAEASLLVPVAEPPPAGAPQQSAEIRCRIVEREGRRLLPGFSDEAALRRLFPAPAPYVLLPAAELCRLALAGGFAGAVLDPGGPVGYMLSRSEAQALAEGQTPSTESRITLSEETRVLVGMPAQRPSEAILARMREVAAQSGAREVWWFWVAIGDGPPHLGLAADPLDAGISERLGRRLEADWAARRPDNPVIDLLALQGDLAETIRRTGECLYRA